MTHHLREAELAWRRFVSAGVGRFFFEKPMFLFRAVYGTGMGNWYR